MAKIKELRLKPVIGVAMSAALDSFEMLCLLFRMHTFAEVKELQT